MKREEKISVLFVLWFVTLCLSISMFINLIVMKDKIEELKHGAETTEEYKGE